MSKKGTHPGKNCSAYLLTLDVFMILLEEGA